MSVVVLCSVIIEEKCGPKTAQTFEKWQCQTLFLGGRKLRRALYSARRNMSSSLERFFQHDLLHSAPDGCLTCAQ